MAIENNDTNILYLIEWENAGGTPTQIANLSTNSPIYNIDLNTRKIMAPSFLGVQNDHQSDIIYFQADRYFDNADLSNTIILIHYKLNTQKEYVYVVPFVDIFTIENKILFPWGISGLVTEYSGLVEFSIKFFKTAKNNNNLSFPELVFELNTLPATSRILQGLAPNLNHAEYREVHIGDNGEEEPINKILLSDQLWSRLENLITASGQWQIYWNEV